MLRPRPARWFEILAARDDATLVLEALARTGAVELEARPGTGMVADPAELAPLLAEFMALSARYQAYWPPESSCRPSAFPQTPLATLQRCLASIEAWARDVEPVVRALQRAEAQRGELQVWQRVLLALPQDGIDPGQWAAAGPLLQVRLFVLPVGSDASLALAQADSAGLEVLSSALDIAGAPHLLVTGQPAALDAMAQRVSALKGVSHAVPPWLRTQAGANRATIEQGLLALQNEETQQKAALDTLARQHDLNRTLGDAHRLQWLMRNVHALEAGRLLCWITGWTSDAHGDTLEHALQASAARALLHYPPPPEGASAPLLLANPPWARPFEIFSRALGMPSSKEADPTFLLAIVVPLMFGFMFADVGQGLVLAAAGWWYRKRFPIARLLMVGGLTASVFGLLFGSVFGLHGLVPALWLHPLDDPLTMLLAPLVGGALLLTLGLVLDAMAAWWRGELRRWLLTDAALIVVYLGVLAAFLDLAALAVALAAALYFSIGHAVYARQWTSALHAIGQLIEKTLQILINTLSFARVGAFALAHAGLSSAIIMLMDAAELWLVKALVLVLGNALVIVLEALVVSIQTTRLVLFEFFTRFVQGQGRAFYPLPPPPYTYQEN